MASRLAGRPVWRLESKEEEDALRTTSALGMNGRYGILELNVTNGWSSSRRVTGGSEEG